MHKISYTIVKKNKYPNAPWYVRKRETGEKPVDVNLETTDKKTAEMELMRVKLAASEGSSDPLGALSVRQKWAQEPVNKANGVLDGWEAWMRVEGFREQSISKYARAVRMLLNGKSVSELTPDLMRNIMARTVNLKANTRRGYADSLRRLCDYLKRPDLAEALPRIKTEITDRPVWTREEMEEIIMSVSTKSAARTEQYRQYFGMMSRIGCRQGECYLLRWKDLDQDTGVVHFRAETTKARKERFCPLPTELWAELEVRRGKPEESMWPDIGADQATRYEALSYAIKKAGVRKGGLHTFRHSVSTILYRQSGCDIQLVSRMLGHSPQIAMQYYVHGQSVEDMRKLVDD